MLDVKYNTWITQITISVDNDEQRTFNDEKQATIYWQHVLMSGAKNAEKITTKTSIVIAENRE